MAKPLQLRAFAPHVHLGTDDAGTRTLSGTIVEFEAPSTTQGVVIHAGALRAREPLDRVKLLLDHDTRQPVGYMTELGADGASATFTVPAGDAGDLALEQARNGLRDGLSVGFAAREYAYDDAYNLHVYDAELYEVSLVAVPDFAGARIAASAALNQEGPRMDRAQLDAALAAGTIDQDTYDAQVAQLEQQPGAALEQRPVEPAQLAAQLAALDVGQLQQLLQGALAVQQQRPAGAVPAEVAAGPRQIGLSAAPGYTRPRGISLRAAAERVAAAANNLQAGPNAAMNVRLALADITQAHDLGHGFIGRDDWLGELWTASSYSRPYIEAIGNVQPLTTVKGRGWRWVTKPAPAEYAGDKAEVPTNTPQTEDDEWTAFRAAGGWDIDRIYVDLADADYIAAFWAAATDEYKEVSDNLVRDRLLAAATLKTGTVTSGGVLAVLKQVIRDGRAVKGGRINRLFLGDGLFEELEDLEVGTNGSLPLWLQSAQVGVDIETATASAGSLVISNDSRLASGGVAGFDSRAVVLREVQPFQVKALDVAHAGIDLGFYSYLRLEPHDPRLLIRRTYTGTAGAGA